MCVPPTGASQVPWTAATHITSRDGLYPAHGYAETGPTCCLWMADTMDHDMVQFAALIPYLVHSQVLAKDVLQRAFPMGPGQQEQMGGTREYLAHGSIFFYAAIFLGVHPDTVYMPLSMVVRGQTTWIPAHVDQDETGVPVPHTYFKGLLDGTAGNRLVVGSNCKGGKITTMYTNPRRGEQLVAVFCPTEQLHFVDSEGAYTSGSKSVPDPTQVRLIPFNSRWVAACLQNGSKTEGGSGLRLAPLKPIDRQPVQCTACMYRFVSPREKPGTWMNHLGAHIAAARQLPFVCFDCSWEHLMGDTSCVFTCG